MKINISFSAYNIGNIGCKGQKRMVPERTSHPRFTVLRITEPCDISDSLISIDRLEMIDQ